MKIVIVGQTGKMGSEISFLAKQRGHQILAGVSSRQESSRGQIENRVVASLDSLDADDIDVVIDFSGIEVFDQVVEWCAKKKVALVSGTTGISPNHKLTLEKGSKHTPIVYSANMSLGVNVLAGLLERLGPLKDFDFQIEEAHHRHKKDKPSGTALLLKTHLDRAIGKSSEEPAVIRGGGIFGEHKVWIMGEEETLTLSHSALNRRVFARGAITAAEWIVGKKPGQYSMKDVLNL